MEPLRLLALLLLLAGLAAATDYGTVSTLDISLSPGGSATKAQEVSRCRDGGCTDTLRLTVSAPPELSIQVSPQEVKVDRARAGESFSANVTVAAQATTPSGRYAGSLRVTSGSGDTWSYKLNIVVGQVAAVPPPATGRTSATTGPSTGGATGGAAAGGSDSTLLIVGGVVVAVVVLLVLLQRRGTLPRGVPRPAPRGRGRGTQAPFPPGARPSPIAALLRPVGAVAGRLLAARSRSRGMDDAQLDSEWRRFVGERIPGEAAAEALEAPAEEVPPPVAGDLPPEEAAPPEAEPAPEPEFIEPETPEEPPAAMADSGPEPAEGGPGMAEEKQVESAPEPSGEMGEEPRAIPGDALAALYQDVERLQAGMGSMADLKTMVERSLDDLRTLREEVDRVRSAPRPAAVPMVPGIVPPDSLKKMQAEMKQEMAAAVEAQMATNVEKLGTWLREAVKAVTLMKAQAPQAGGAPGSVSSLQPLFDGLWKEVGSLRSAIQRLETETKASLQEVARQRVPGESFAKETLALKFAIEKQQAEMAVLVKEVGALRSAGAGGTPESGVALQADFEALRSILRDHQRQMEGVEARLKNQELTFARGDEVRNLFRDLSALKEDFAEVRMVLEEARLPTVAVETRDSGAERALRVPAAPAGARVLEAAAPPPRAPRDAPEVEEARRDIEKAEAFLKSLEEYHRSGLMPERLYLEKRGQSEERLKELKRKLRG